MNKNNKGTCLLLNKIVRFLVCVKISKLWWWHSPPNEPTMDHSQMWLHKCEWINVECNVPTFCAVSVLLFFFFPSFFFLLNFLHEACNKSFSLLALVTFFFPLSLRPSDAPSLKDIREEDSCLFLSRSAPVAMRARQAHNALLQSMNLPWWRRLGDEFSSPESPSQKDYDVEFESLYLGRWRSFTTVLLFTYQIYTAVFMPLRCLSMSFITILILYQQKERYE